VRALLAHGAKPNLADRHKLTPLHAAIEAESLPVIKALLDKGANPNVPDLNGETPLGRAARNGATESALLLLTRGASAKVAKKDGATPLHGAASRGDARLVRELLKRGVSIDAMDKNGITPLMLAVAHDARLAQKETTQLLLQAGADARLKQRDGTNALHAAVFPQPFPAIVQLLLAADADPFARDDKGDTPLHYLVSAAALSTLDAPPTRGVQWAAKWDEARAAAWLLLQGGANPNSKDKEGLSALDMLRANRDAAIAANDTSAKLKYDETIEVLEGKTPLSFDTAK
jgi:ankyrin repeat protein